MLKNEETNETEEIDLMTPAPELHLPPQKTVSST